jgi:hypothetical protein
MKTIFARVQSAPNKGAPARRKTLRFSVVGLFLLIVCFVAVRSCSHHSPTVDVLGSYFPAWMICILSGLALTLTARWIVKARHLEPYMGPAPLIYSCLMIIFTFATWILFYQN